MKNLSFVFSVFFLILTISVGCVKNKKSLITSADTIKEYTSVEINMSPEFYDSVVKSLSAPRYIILKESDNTLFSEIDKIVADDDKYYILDSYGAKTVVSFTQDGTSYAKYGNIGQGPGEYVRPWDMTVDNHFLYILDSNIKKILRFEKSGKYVDERTIPFRALGFKRLDNGDFIFNLMPDGEEESPRLCRTDSTISNVEYFIGSPKGYLGGYLTTDVFKSGNNLISFYNAPGDTLYYLDNNGNPQGGIVFDFGNRGVPETAKIDYLTARTKGELENTLMLTTNPVPLENGVWIATLTDDESQYIVFFDPKMNKCGVRKCNPSKSVYDIIEPATTNNKGDLVCYTTQEFLRKAADFDSLPDSIRNGLGDNYHVLTIYSFVVTTHL